MAYKAERGPGQAWARKLTLIFLSEARPGQGRSSGIAGDSHHLHAHTAGAVLQ